MLLRERQLRKECRPKSLQRYHSQAKAQPWSQTLTLRRPEHEHPSPRDQIVGLAQVEALIVEIWDLTVDHAVDTDNLKVRMGVMIVRIVVLLIRTKRGGDIAEFIRCASCRSRHWRNC